MSRKLQALPELDIIEREVASAHLLLEAMASFANESPQPSGFSPMSIRSLLDQTGALLRLVIPAGVDLSVNAQPETFPNIEPRALQQVIMNLTLNARDATIGEGKITITASTGDGGDVFIRVTDTGSGMTASQLERAFEPYFTTKGSAGTGLGLAICREVVERQSGSLTLESTLGEGTTATIRLPTAKVLSSV